MKLNGFSMADNYVCSLDAASLKRARDELNEDPADRMDSVEAFRELIRTRAPHIICSVETDFLLRFLRVSKFSQLAALKRLEKYLDFFVKCPEWIRDVDPLDPKLLALLDIGFFVPLGFDDQGRRVIMANFGNFDPKSKKYDKRATMHAFAILLFYCTDERTQVNGIVFFADCTVFTLKHQTYWSLDEVKKNISLIDGTFPCRWKQLIYFNMGPFFETLMLFFKPFMKKKLQERIVLPGSNLEAVYDKLIPKRLLPVEYLPDDYTGPNNGTTRELIDKFMKEMKDPEFVARIKYETSTAFRLDESKRPKDDVPLATFRKLNVD